MNHTHSEPLGEVPEFNKNISKTETKNKKKKEKKLPLSSRRFSSMQKEYSSEEV